MNEAAFSGRAVDHYAERPKRQVPGFSDLHRMAILLLGERVPAQGRLLVLGAGGGLELRSFAAAQPGWTFDGVDPSADMLRLATEVTAEYADRIALHEGTIEVAPAGPFDGATSFLTFHFIPREARLETLRQLRRRLRDGAPLLLAHISFPQTEPERSQWIARHVAYGAPDVTDPDQLAASRLAIASRLTILSPEEEQAMLAEAGFAGSELFYAGLSFRGWIAYAA